MTDPTSTATGTFTIRGWDEQPYAEAEGAPKLTHARVTTAYTGELDGQGTYALLMVYDQADATYTGVTPKWVIQRSRLHQAVERLDQGDHVDLGFLARELGYFDQAHFTRDFRATVGHPPTAYTRSAGGDG